MCELHTYFTHILFGVTIQKSKYIQKKTKHIDVVNSDKSMTDIQQRFFNKIPVEYYFFL